MFGMPSLWWVHCPSSRVHTLLPQWLGGDMAPLYCHCQLQPTLLLSLEVLDYITNKLGTSFEAIFLPNPPCGNFLPGPTNRWKGTFMFDFDWMLMVIQSMRFPSTTSAYTNRAMERGRLLYLKKRVL